MKEQKGKSRRKARILLTVILLSWSLWYPGDPRVSAGETAQTETISQPEQLYAQSAVLMDADSGRILFGQNAREERPMASTTKIMTCILALENGDLDETVTASSCAASQPEVRLGVREGMQFRLEDLLYSLMLESHNDAAVMIAEKIGTTLEGFAELMNRKAKELGCENTHYITPNGLDASDEGGSHHTTAEDLARVMKYCIMDSPQREAFLKITQTPSWQFTDLSGRSSYYCNNHNAFLKMMEGALSGKTGFTGEAGYCYVGALENEGRTFIVALLACGWPNNKGYKWKDTRKLMEYGIDHFHYQDIPREFGFEPLSVAEGVPDGGRLSGTATVSLKEADEDAEGGEGAAMAEKRERLLLRDDETVEVEISAAKALTAPVEAGTEVGSIRYLLNGEEIGAIPVVTAESVEKRDYCWCLERIVSLFALGI